MSNVLIEGIISLAGRGFVARKNGNFQPGEFKRLSNLEIDSNGVLTNRRNIVNVGSTAIDAAQAPYVNLQRFLGVMGPYSIVSDSTNQYALGTTGRYTLWNTFAGAAPAQTLVSGSRFVGYFRYNRRNYWIVIEADQPVQFRLVLYSDVNPTDIANPSIFDNAYAAGLLRTVILTFTWGSVDHNNFDFFNFFVYKERLWLATSVGLYFSKATDPTVFATPDGGFFKHPGDTVRWAVALKDTIYTFCDDAVYALTYSTDPNTDSTERPISTNIGAEMACVHLDTVYFINNLGIFAVNGSRIDKVMDSRFDVGEDIYRNRIFSFENYLIVIKQAAPLNKNAQLYDGDQILRFSPFFSGNTLGYNVYFINTDTGSVHVVDFTDQYQYFDAGGCGFILDGITNPHKDSSGNYKWTFFTGKMIDGSNPATYQWDCYPYYISSSDSTSVNDFAFNTAGVLKRMGPKIEVEIDSFVPDGLEYKDKKFRSLLIQGVFPALTRGMQVITGYNNKNFDTPVAVGYTATDPSPREHYAHRIGLNQRAKSLSLRIYNSLWETPITEAFGKVEISDMRVMWTYIKRLPTTKNIGS